jgi:hypothetical protein
VIKVKPKGIKLVFATSLSAALGRLMEQRLVGSATGKGVQV